MSRSSGFSIAAVKSVFCEEITAAGGNVSDTFEDESRLFMRSILPLSADVGLNDGVHGGVALRVSECQVWVHPYVFRQVCSNGDIRAQAIHSTHIDDLDLLSDDEACETVREAIQHCCTAEAFNMSVDEMRTAQDKEADVFLSLMPLISRLPAESASGIMRQIFSQFVNEHDTSRFGLMNAVTAVARDNVILNSAGASRNSGEAFR
ncbi:MAG: hypothetical protein JWN70_7024 [Planctomycetaceae bacterium]|nr:hypothetical protein [Planctomycetaceae bacterium]